MNELLKSRVAFSEIQVPQKSGIYAIFLKPGVEFLGNGIGANGLIYIGMSSNLYNREFNDHFESKNTGFSTLRRSIGAVFKEKFSLRAIPRGTGPSESNFRCYCFKPEDEEKITAWMRVNLDIGACSIGAADLKKVEAELIKEYMPLLCLKGWNNPFRKHIKELRKRCADEAQNYKHL
jgi:hypothetical protein